jgi:hypothetical protein
VATVKKAKTKEFRITSQTICDLGACGYGQREFAKKYPDGITAEQALKKLRSGAVNVAGHDATWLTRRVGLPSLVTADDMRVSLSPAQKEAKKKAIAKARTKAKAVEQKIRVLEKLRESLWREEDKIDRTFDRSLNVERRRLARERNAKALKTVTPERIEEAVRVSIAARRASRGL